MLTNVKGIGAKTAETLNLLEIYTVEDLVGFMPSEYLDLSRISVLKESAIGDFVLLRLVLTDVKPLVKRGKLAFTIAYGRQNDDRVKLVWYNLPYVSKLLKKDMEIVVYGKLNFDGSFAIVNPQFEKADAVKLLRGIRPIYKTKGIVSQATMSRLIHNALENYLPVSIIPEAEREKYGLEDYARAISEAHFPASVETGKAARRRVYVETAVKLIKNYKQQRKACANIKSFCYSAKSIESAISALPYRLSQSQIDALQGLMRGLKGCAPLNALLEGDVGSGKTVVALLLAYFAAQSGYQTALLVPTSILAEQHFATAKTLFKNLPFRAELFTSADTAKERAEKVAKLRDGKIDLAIGTQSLLSPKITWKNLSLLIVDEQHKFGIKDREKLIEASNGLDSLSMTATPIPRSLALIYFGGTEVYSLDNRTARDNVKTYIVGREKREGLLSYLIRQAENGRGIFVVAPAIDDMEGIELSGATELAKELQSKTSLSIACLHSKLKEEEKNLLMKSFSCGEIKMLVATSIVEVGIDVPDASVLAIMHADRFGLATLHQLRGRIGRAGRPSESYLYTEKDGETLVRLKMFASKSSGAEIAMLDYERRGAGELLGYRQSGRDKALAMLSLADLRIASLIEEVILH